MRRLLHFGRLRALSAWCCARSASTAAAENDPASLARLHDVVSASAPGWWPLAPGWYVLGFALLCAGTFLGWRIHRRRQIRRYRVEALAELRALAAANSDDARVIAEIMSLLRRCALAAWPRESVVVLHGSAWWRFLDDTMGATGFSGGLGAACAQVVYANTRRARSRTELLPQLRDAAARWITTHRAPDATPSRHMRARGRRAGTL